ncbi:MAG: SPOR domain-containing protein [Magnetococcus sp. WYHC-3]
MDIGAQVVEGRFTITEELARGTTGPVWLARDHVADQDVDLMLLPDAIGQDVGLFGEFRHAFHQIQTLRHPGIAPWRRQVLDRESNRHLLVMPHVPGRLLCDHRRSRPGLRLGLPEAVRILRQITDALSYAHGQTPSLSHRALVPENVLMAAAATPEGAMAGDAVLLNFGLAHEIRMMLLRQSGPGGVSESPAERACMAPELFLVRRADGTLQRRAAAHFSAHGLKFTGPLPGPESDQYALAALFHELISARPPVASEALLAWVSGEEGSGPRPLEELSPVQNAALLRALARNPAARFERLDGLVNALEGTLTVPFERGGRKGPVHPVTPPPRRGGMLPPGAGDFLPPLPLRVVAGEGLRPGAATAESTPMMLREVRRETPVERPAPLPDRTPSPGDGASPAVAEDIPPQERAEAPTAPVAVVPLPEDPAPVVVDVSPPAPAGGGASAEDWVALERELARTREMAMPLKAETASSDPLPMSSVSSRRQPGGWLGVSLAVLVVAAAAGGWWLGRPVSDPAPLLVVGDGQAPAPGEVLPAPWAASQATLSPGSLPVTDATQQALQRAEARLAEVDMRLRRAETRVAELERQLAEKPGVSGNEALQRRLAHLEARSEATQLPELQQELALARQQVAGLQARLEASEQRLTQAQERFQDLLEERLEAQRRALGEELAALRPGLPVEGAPPQPPAPRAGGWSVQMASHLDATQAAETLKRMALGTGSESGALPLYQEQALVLGRHYYRVRVGPFESRAAALEAAARVEALTGIAGLLVRNEAVAAVPVTAAAEVTAQADAAAIPAAQPPPAATDPQVPPTVTPGTQAGGYMVQLMAHQDLREAEALRDKLGNLTLDGAPLPLFIQEAQVNGLTYHRVRLGPFPNRAAARQAAQVVQTRWETPGVVVAPGTW